MQQWTFYEFFAGGGMARAGLGDGWQCLLANDISPMKAAAYAGGMTQPGTIRIQSVMRFFARGKPVVYAHTGLIS